MTRPLPTRWVWEQDGKSWLTIEVYDEGAGVYLRIAIAGEPWALEDEADIDRFAEALKRCLRDAKERTDG